MLRPRLLVKMVSLPVIAGIAALALLVTVPGAWSQTNSTSFKFSFGPGKVTPGYTQVLPATAYTNGLGYGFDPGSTVTAVDRGADDPLRAGFCTSSNLFFFSVAVPDGNYTVTVTLGDAKGESMTTVKAEARRLMLERVHTEVGKFETRSFMVNVRTPKMPPGNSIKLNTREWNPQTGQAVTPTWDDKLTLQFGDERPCLCAVEIEKVEDAVTIFLVSDSTVTDQPREPYGTWGQMLSRWFKPPVAIANHAESGETLKAFRAQRRWDKVMSQMKPGDYVFMQFGHNDLNKTGHDGIWPREDTMGDWAYTHSEANTDYKWLLAANAVEVKRRGGIPVIVSPMTKIDFRSGQINVAGLGDYPKAAVEAAQMAGAVCIDLNAMSVELCTALGTNLDRGAYVDGLHTDTYGGYLLSRCIVEGIKQAKLDLVKYLVDDAGTFDPKPPQPLPDDFKLPLEPRPAGGFGLGPGRGRGAPTPAMAPTNAPATTNATRRGN